MSVKVTKMIREKKKAIKEPESIYINQSNNQSIDRSIDENPASFITDSIIQTDNFL